MTIRGTMKNRVQLQKPVFGTNDANEELQSETWAVVAEVWASIQPIGGNEYNQASSQQAKLTVLIQVFNIKGKTSLINSSMRFFHQASGAVYNISNYRKQFVQTDRIIFAECIQDESRSVTEDL